VRWNMNTDTPLPPEEPAGKNPPDGAILDYWLGAAAKEVSLEILDASGKPVRRFSSTDVPAKVDEQDLNVPTYWVRTPQVLSAAAGFHRFVWDLHYPPPDAERRDYPMTAILHDTPRHPLGPWVVPGKYTVKLTAGGRSESRTLTVALDPRVRVSSEDLAAQLEVSMRVCQAIHDDAAALKGVRALRARLKAVRERAAKGPPADAIATLDAKAAALEGSAGGFGGFPGPGADQDSLSRSNGRLVSLLGVLQEADAKPTAAAIASETELQKSLASQLSRWSGLKSGDLPALNQELRNASLPPITIAEPPKR
jgi:hypothetical protein